MISLPYLTAEEQIKHIQDPPGVVCSADINKEETETSSPEAVLYTSDQI